MSDVDSSFVAVLRQHVAVALALGFVALLTSHRLNAVNLGLVFGVLALVLALPLEILALPCGSSPCFGLG